MPIVEELYFRRAPAASIGDLRAWAPVLNTVLFSLYPLWTPRQNPARIVATLPLYYLSHRTRSGYLAIVVHAAATCLGLLRWCP